MVYSSGFSFKSITEPTTAPVVEVTKELKSTFCGNKERKENKNKPQKRTVLEKRCFILKLKKYATSDNSQL